MNSTEHIARMGRNNNAYSILGMIPEGQKPFGKPRRGWKDNVKMVLSRIMWREVEWMNPT
jgi:hypothetical protein